MGLQKPSGADGADATLAFHLPECIVLLPRKVVALPIAFLHWVHTTQGLPHMVQSCFAACVACSPGFPSLSPIPSGIQVLV